MSEKQAIKSAMKELAVAKKVFEILNRAEKSDAASFFSPNDELYWDKFTAWDACNFWIKRQLDPDEREIYEELYEYEFDDYAAMKSQVAADTNRMPCSGNSDGY